MVSPPSDTLIDVAKAIATEQTGREGDWTRYLLTARAAIKGMDNPSHAMCDAGREGLPLASGQMMQAWQRMLKAAL